MSNVPHVPESKWGPGAEQDRHGSRFGLSPDNVDAIKATLASGPGAEQERYGARFGVGEETAGRMKDAMTSGPGAEQERYASHWEVGQETIDKAKGIRPSGPGAEQERYTSRWGLRPETVETVKTTVTSGPGAEQDRYGSHWGLREETTEKVKKTLTSGPGAEQDRYGSYWGVKEETTDRIKTAMTSGPGAEQDRYGSYWGLREGTADRVKAAMTSGPGAEQERYAAYWSLRDETTDRIKRTLSRNDFGPGAEQDRYGKYFGLRREDLDKAKQVASKIGGARFYVNPNGSVGPGSVGVVGILQSTILPSFALSSGITLIAYTGARLTNRVEAKDWAWPTGQLLNAWWSAIGRRMYHYGIPFSTAWSDLSYPEKLLLGGVTAWALRLFYRVSSRSVARGEDDPRYEAEKKDPKFWEKAAVNLFLPEAVFQTLISLPFTLTFRLGPSAAVTPAPAFAELAHVLSVFLFGSGLALETVADVQLATFNKQNTTDLNREGVWSIVRHPNYLGDATVHAAFPLFLYSCGLLHPLALVGPIANYAFLRYFGGDKANDPREELNYQTSDAKKLEQLQEYRKEKNSFWPKVQELGNPWFLAVTAAGAGCVIIERGVREYLLH